MDFGISTNKALVVASAAVIEALLESQKSQINAAKNVADAQGSVAQGQANATVESGNAQAAATRAASYVSLTQSIAASVGAAGSLSTLNESRTAFSARNTELDTISMKAFDVNNVESTVAGRTPTALAARNGLANQLDVDQAVKAISDMPLGDKLTESAKNAVKGKLTDLSNRTLTKEQYDSLAKACAEKTKSITDNFNNAKETIYKKGEFAQGLSQGLSGFSAFSSAVQASNEAAKAQQDAISQVDGAVNQQTQSSYQQLLDARQNLAQEISKVLDSETQALQAVGLRG